MNVVLEGIGEITIVYYIHVVYNIVYYVKCCQ